MRSSFLIWLLVAGCRVAPAAGEYDVEAEILSDTCGAAAGARLTERLWVETSKAGTPLVEISLPLGIVLAEGQSLSDQALTAWAFEPDAYNLGTGLRYVGDSREVSCGPSVRRLVIDAASASSTRFDLYVTQDNPPSSGQECLVLDQRGAGQRVVTVATPSCRIESRHRYRHAALR